MSDNKDLTYFIVEQFSKLGLEVFGMESARPNLQAYCFKGHDEKTPSLSIRRSDGRFLCFGCGVKGHNWNHIAKYVKVDPLDDESMPDPFWLLSNDLKKVLEEADDEFELPWDLDPWTGSYKHDKSIISPYTLEALDAYKWYDDFERCYRLLLPVYQYGDLRGWVARRLDKKKDMKYRNAPRMKSREILYPLDIVEEMDTDIVVLVEGPLDAVRLLNFDVPALAIMGTNNFDAETSTIDLSNIGIESVIIATDSDESGDKARKEIHRGLYREFDLDHFKCPAGQDPGGMHIAYLKKLWRLTRPVGRPYRYA